MELEISMMNLSKVDHSTWSPNWNSKRPVHLIAGWAIRSVLHVIHVLLAPLPSGVKLAWEPAADRLGNLTESQLTQDSMWAAAGFLALETPSAAHEIICKGTVTGWNHSGLFVVHEVIGCDTGSSVSGAPWLLRWQERESTTRVGDSCETLAWGNIRIGKGIHTRRTLQILVGSMGGEIGRRNLHAALPNMGKISSQCRRLIARYRLTNPHRRPYFSSCGSHVSKVHGEASNSVYVFCQWSAKRFTSND